MSRRLAGALGLVCLLLAAADQGPRYGRVVLPDGTPLQVEVAYTPQRRALGYMFREHVGPEDGMIFPFEDDDVHPFWMKNVRFALDMLWISREGEVVHVEAQVPPCREDPCPTVGPRLQARYVLELAGGGAAALGLKTGDRLQILLPDDPGD